MRQLPDSAVLNNRFLTRHYGMMKPLELRFVCRRCRSQRYRLYGQAADYSQLVGALAKTPAERRELLQGFFEPTEAELDAGAKLPTPAPVVTDGKTSFLLLPLWFPCFDP